MTILRSSIICFLFQIIFSGGLTAQIVFPVNDKDKIIYHAEVDLDTNDIPEAWESAILFMDGLSIPEVQENNSDVDRENRIIESRFGFYLYREIAFLKQIEGLVTAQVTTEFSGEHIHLFIHQIKFQYYERDRYGKFSPKSSRKNTLESLVKRKKGDSWNSHFETIDSKIKKIIHEFESTIPVAVDSISRSDPVK